jgi:hypothetical protein
MVFFFFIYTQLVDAKVLLFLLIFSIKIFGAILFAHCARAILMESQSVQGTTNNA